MKHKGFTLIELLVVISVISLLASIVLTSVNGARSKARDAIRRQDLTQIALALELYYDKYGTYPPYSSPCNGALNAHNDAWCRDTQSNDGVTPIDPWIPGLGEFMPKMPHNPKPYNAGNPWPYHYNATGPNNYYLMVGLENSTSDTCAGGAVYQYLDGGNACAYWGGNLYVKTVR